MNSLHILVCDDEQNICQLLMDLFAQFGHQVVTCQSGEEAISLISFVQIDLGPGILHSEGFSPRFFHLVSAYLVI